MAPCTLAGISEQVQISAQIPAICLADDAGELLACDLDYHV